MYRICVLNLLYVCVFFLLSQFTDSLKISRKIVLFLVCFVGFAYDLCVGTMWMNFFLCCSSVIGFSEATELHMHVYHIFVYI